MYGKFSHVPSCQRLQQGKTELSTNAKKTDQCTTKLRTNKDSIDHQNLSYILQRSRTAGPQMTVIMFVRADDKNIIELQRLLL